MRDTNSMPLLQSRHVPSIPRITRARQPLVFLRIVEASPNELKDLKLNFFHGPKIPESATIRQILILNQALYVKCAVNCPFFSNIQTSVSHIAGANRLIGVFRIALANTLSNIFVIKSTFHCPLSSRINWSIVSRFSENSSGFWRGCGCNKAQQSSQI